MNLQEIQGFINLFEERSGESFPDYFSHDYFCEKKWINFLEKKGFKKISLKLKKELEEGGILDIEDQFNIYPIYCVQSNYKFLKENYDKNIKLQSEFILSDKSTYKDFKNFFQRNLYLIEE